MRILFLDIASRDGLIAAVTPEAVAASKPIDHRITDSELVPTIESVLQRAGWTYQDLTHIACVTGPGGFMSLKVSASAANAIGWTLHIPLAGIHLSDLYAVRASSLEPRATSTKESALVPNARSSQLAARSFLWLHSTKKTELFVRGFGAWAQKWPDAVHMQLQDLLRSLVNCQLSTVNCPYSGELVPEHEAALAARGLQPLSMPPVESILPSFLAAQSYGGHALQPWYGRGI